MKHESYADHYNSTLLANHQMHFVPVSLKANGHVKLAVKEDSSNTSIHSAKLKWISMYELQLQTAGSSQEIFYARSWGGLS